MTPEGKVKEIVKRVLGTLPHHYRFMPVQRGMGMPGLDFFCCINGYFIGIETKAPGKKPTPRQDATIAEIKAAGGTVYVIHDRAEAEDMARHLLLGLF